LHGTEVKVSHIVTNFEFLYEPFYVAPDTVPLHDERFLGYGFTRNTQVCNNLVYGCQKKIMRFEELTVSHFQVYEMYVAGYQFHVLTPVFTIHWGLQNRKGRPSWRERQNSKNRKHFDQFKREVFVRYHKDPLNMVVNHQSEH
jgi:N-acetyllactosaminide beta-1,3-N-acetylglucosaminyltransferase